MTVTLQEARPVPYRGKPQILPGCQLPSTNLESWIYRNSGQDENSSRLSQTGKDKIFINLSY